MDRSPNVSHRARRTRRQRIYDVLGYVALVILVALIVHKHAGLFSRAPDQHLATVQKTGSPQPAADR